MFKIESLCGSDWLPAVRKPSVDGIPNEAASTFLSRRDAIRACAEVLTACPGNARIRDVG